MRQRITLSKSLGLLGAALGAVAPVATVSQQTAPGTPGIQQARTQAPAQQGMTQSLVIQASQTLSIKPRFGGFHMGPTTGIHTFPAWNQRKARRAARQTGRKVQKRYQR